MCVCFYSFPGSRGEKRSRCRFRACRSHSTLSYKLVPAVSSRCLGSCMPAPILCHVIRSPRSCSCKIEDIGFVAGQRHVKSNSEAKWHGVTLGQWNFYRSDQLQIPVNKYCLDGHFQLFLSSFLTSLHTEITFYTNSNNKHNF